MARDQHDSKTASLPQMDSRQRVSVDVTPSVSLVLDHISEVTGQTKSAIVGAALLDVLPDLLSRADSLKKRAHELSQVKRK